MKKFSALSMFVALAVFVSCQKEQTEEQRNAEIERQVQQRLAAEHQASEQQQLAQREAELNAREKTLAQRENAAASTPAERGRAPSVAYERRGAAAAPATATYSTFYTKLAPYGVWRETGDYGYVWQPREAEASRSWRPYTNGRWVYTDVGWTWISTESFGWATYHYGRWTRLRNIGWVWVPGDEWAPAWVSWRKSNDYVGWAPLPPEARFDRRTGIHTWSDNYYDIGPDQYAFVPVNEFGAQRIESTVVPRERNVTIVNETTNVTNITYSNTTIINQGPDYDELRSRSREPIQRLRLERETTFDVGAEPSRSVVRGEVIVVAAPVIAAPQRAERPATVKETIAQAIVDLGWAAIADHQAAEKARAKMKSEAKPPVDAPPKKFVKPATASTETNLPASVAPMDTTAPSPTSTSTIPIAPASASPMATARPRTTPARSTETAEPSMTPIPTPSPTPMVRTPEPTITATPIRPRTIGPRPLATSSPSVVPSAPSTPSATATATFTIKPQAESAQTAESSVPIRPLRRPSSPAAEAPKASVSGSAAPSASPVERLTKEEKKKQKRERKEAVREGDTVSPSPSPP